MWKLTIKQKRKYTHTDAFYTESVEFVGDHIEELALLVMKMSKMENAIETSYHIERAGEANE